MYFKITSGYSVWVECSLHWIANCKSSTSKTNQLKVLWNNQTEMQASIKIYTHCSYSNLLGCTFRKFVSDNMILLGMTVTFFSKTCRLSFILLKQNININSLTSIKLKYVFQRHSHSTKITCRHTLLLSQGCLCPPKSKEVL